MQQRRVRVFSLAEHAPRISEIAHLYGNTEPVVISTMLTNEGLIMLRKRVQADLFSLVLRESKQLQALCRGKQLATWHCLGCSENEGFSGHFQSPQIWPISAAKIETVSPAGRLVFHVFAALAEFERNLIRERTVAGLKAARARGRKGGRPAKLSAKEIKLTSCSRSAHD
jgi:hypothetical protein